VDNHDYYNTHPLCGSNDNNNHGFLVELALFVVLQALPMTTLANELSSLVKKKTSSC